MDRANVLHAYLSLRQKLCNVLADAKRASQSESKYRWGAIARHRSLPSRAICSLESWTSPVTFKVYLRAVNKFTEISAHPMPTMEHELHKLAKLK